jgi:hypothetical protein
MLELSTKGYVVRVITLCFGLLAAGSAFGGIIPVGNSLFDNSSAGYGNPIGWTLFTDSASPTFSSNVQVVTNNGSVFPVVTGVAGSQFAAVDIDHNDTNTANPIAIIPPDGSLAELTSDNLGVFAPNTSYTLTAGVGLDSISSNTMSVGLALGSGDPSLIDVFPVNSTASFASAMINGTALSNDVLFYETITLDTDIDPGLVGQSINVSLLFDSDNEFGREALFDNVSLSDASDVPEPGSIALVALGCMVLAKTRRARRLGLDSKRVR